MQQQLQEVAVYLWWRICITLTSCVTISSVPRTPGGGVHLPEGSQGGVQLETVSGGMLYGGELHGSDGGEVSLGPQLLPVYLQAPGVECVPVAARIIDGESAGPPANRPTGVGCG